MATYAASGYVAVVPFDVAVEKEVRKGIALAKQKTALIETKVVFGDKDLKYLEGDTVYLRGDCIQLPWARETFQIGDKRFVLVPVGDVRAVTPGKELVPGVEPLPCPYPVPYPYSIPYVSPIDYPKTVPSDNTGTPWFPGPYKIWCNAAPTEPDNFVWSQSEAKKKGDTNVIV